MLSSVADARAGGTCLFVGTVRNHDAKDGASARAAVGEQTEHAQSQLDYSAHPQAAEVARALAESWRPTVEACGSQSCTASAGSTWGTWPSWSAVSAEHRGEAFDVCRELIDEFKATVPIWKHQRFADGSDAWVGLP